MLVLLSDTYSVPLTPREREVLTLLVDGLMNKEIGRRLGTTTRTVRNQLVSVYQKLGVDSRVSAAVWYVRQEAMRQMQQLQQETMNQLNDDEAVWSYRMVDGHIVKFHQIR